MFRTLIDGLQEDEDLAGSEIEYKRQENDVRQRDINFHSSLGLQESKPNTYSLVELHAVKPAMSAKKTVHSGKRSAIGASSSFSSSEFPSRNPFKRDLFPREKESLLVTLPPEPLISLSRTFFGKREDTMAVDCVAL